MCEKNQYFQKFQIFWKNGFFEIFFLRIGLDWRALVASRIPNIEKQREFFSQKFWFSIKKKEFFIDIFWRYLDFFFGFFGFFLDIFWLVFIFFIVFFLNIGFVIILFFILDIFQIIFKVTNVTTKIREVTTEHQKWPKISTNSVKSTYFARRTKKALAKNSSPPL